MFQIVSARTPQQSRLGRSSGLPADEQVSSVTLLGIQSTAHCRCEFAPLPSATRLWLEANRLVAQADLPTGDHRWVLLGPSGSLWVLSAREGNLGIGLAKDPGPTIQGAPRTSKRQIAELPVQARLEGS